MTVSSTLIATLGGKPQLITLALDCLAQAGESVGEVLVVHAAPERAETKSALAALNADFPKSYPGVSLRYLCLSRGNQPLEDVTSPEEVDAAFQSLYSAVREMKWLDKRVHLLIAGGRRTLTVFGMAAAQMLFDDEDRLWHLASHPDLESSGRLHAGEGEWARLIPIPVVAWGELSPAFHLLAEVNHPLEAARQLREFRLREQWDMARIFILTKITPGERTIVELLAKEGLSQSEIAARLSLSIRTVENHLRSVYRKAEEHWDMEGVNQTRLMRLLGLFFSTYKIR